MKTGTPGEQVNKDSWVNKGSWNLFFLAQTLVVVIALIIGKHRVEVSSVAEIVLLNGFFIALFLGSAWLFRHAAQGNKGAGNVTGINEQALQ